MEGDRGQMHKKQHQEFPVQQSLGRGGSRRQSKGKRGGPPGESLEAESEDGMHCAPVTKQLDPTRRERGWTCHQQGCRAEEPHSSITEPQGGHGDASWPGREGTVSQRRSIGARVVEGTEVLVSAVALFGKVSTDRAVGFVFHGLGAIRRWAGVLDKRPAFQPSRVSLLFMKAFPEGTPVAWPRKGRFCIDPPPTTTIWTGPGAKASPKWASSPGRRGEAQQWWDHWSPGSWRTSVKG